MKVTRILDFTEDEVKALTAAGTILGEVAKAFQEDTTDSVELGTGAAELVNALKEVLFRIGHDEGK